MRCPKCGHDDTKVVDSRTADDGSAIRRRRQCLACEFRFTTFERSEEQPLLVVKRSGERVPFDRTKVEAGLTSASKGRSLDPERLAEIVVVVEDRARLAGGEVTSSEIGLTVLEQLRELDGVTYMRFASVYKGFEDPADFAREAGLFKRSEPKRRDQP